MQTGHEKTITGLLAQLAGASVIYGAGMLESGVTFDLAQLVIDAEIIAMTKHARRGIEVGDATTAIEEIIEVGPASHFLERASTLKGVREMSLTRYFDRQVREGWEMAGSPEVYQLARRKARQLLAEHAVEPLPTEAVEEMRALVIRADREEAGVQG